jgi:hypothetical protein
MVTYFKKEGKRLMKQEEEHQVKTELRNDLVRSTPGRTEGEAEVRRAGAGAGSLCWCC